MANDLGISIRLVRGYDVSKDDGTRPLLWDVAFQIALSDTRDVELAVKMRDALHAVLEEQHMGTHRIETKS